jgi:hypothetical protein
MFVTTLLAVSLAAPVPKVKAPVLYYPTVEGTKRVMQAKVGDRTTETTETVSKVAEKDGTFTVTVSREIAGRTLDSTFEVSAKGVFRRPTAGPGKGEPQAVFKLPAKEGDTWTVEQQGFGKDATVTATYTVGKTEQVTVPAGLYTATAVTLETELNGRAAKNTSWYAPGVGVVKIVSEVNGAERVTELKEFTPGKAK